MTRELLELAAKAALEEQPEQCSNTFGCKCQKHFNTDPMPEPIAMGSIGMLWPTPSMDLTDEQAAEVGRILVRHLRAGATIKGTPTCCSALADGSIDGQLSIYYNVENAGSGAQLLIGTPVAGPKDKPLTKNQIWEMISMQGWPAEAHYRIEQIVRDVERAHGIE